MSRLALACCVLASAALGAEADPLEALWAAEPFSLPADALARAGLSDAPRDAPVDLLLVETRITFDAQGRRTFRYRTVFRVLKPEAVSAWESVGAGWAPWYEERPTLRARVLTPAGREVALDPATASEKAAFDDARSMYSDLKSVRAPLPGLAVGATVEQEVVVTEAKPPFPAGNAGRVFFHRSTPVRRFHVVFDAPEALPLSVAWSGTGMASVLKTAATSAGRRRVEASFPDPGWDPEVHAPSDYPLATFTSGSSWAEVAKAYGAWLREAAAGGVDTSELAARASKAKTKQQKVQTALSWLQGRVRYTGLELAEATLKPWSPAQVWERQYGDCKDMSLFLVEALKALGVKAQVALLSASGALDVPDALPGLGLFDHAIVRVPPDAAGPELWVDPTHAGLPAGALPAADLERRALVIDDATTGLVRTPARLAQRSGVSDLVQIELGAFGRSQVRERRTYTGSSSGDMRAAFRETSPEKLRDAFEGRARGFFRGSSFEVSLHNVPTDSGPFAVELDVSGARAFSTDWSEARLVLPEHTILENLPEYLRAPGQPERAPAGLDQPARPLRVAPFEWREPLWLERTFSITPPRGFRLEGVPEDATRAFGTTATWTEAYLRRKDGGVEATYRLVPKATSLSAADVRAFRAAWTTLRDRDRPTLVFKHEALALVNTDQAVKGVALFRTLLQQEPDDALTRARLSTALLDLGLGLAARAEADHAVLDAPAEPGAQMAQGSIAEHDLFGRLFQPGFDRPLALAALRRAAELDPGSAWATRELARVLERDATGDLTSEGGDASEAVKLWRALALDGNERDAAAPYLAALWRGRRWGDLVEASERLDAPGLAERALAGVAVLQGAKAAAARAREKWPDSQARARAVLMANQSLLFAREYAIAREWLALHRGLLPPETSTQVLALVTKLSRAVPTRSLKTAEQAMRTLIGLPLEADTPRVYLDRLRELSSLAMRRHLTEDEARLASPARLAARLGYDAGAREVMMLGLDSLLSSAAFQVEGSEAVGYRVTARADVGGRKLEVRGYFVSEGGEVRLLATESAFGALGERVLTLAKADRVDAAAQWASWSAQALPEVRVPHVLLFHELWPPAGRPTAEGLALAGAVLATEDPSTGGAALDLVVSAAERAAGGRRLKLLRTAGFGALRARRFDVAAKALAPLVADDESAEETSPLVSALVHAARYDEAEAIVRRRLARLPDGPEWLEWSAQLAMRRKQYAEAVKIYARLLDRKGDATSALNNAAWARLMAGQLDDETERLAQRAVETEGKDAIASLHTLSLVQLERGKVRSAVEALRLRLSRLPQGELQGADWYVVGRLAEVFGYLAEAKNAYGKAKQEEDEDVFVLAERRLTKLRGP